MSKTTKKSVRNFATSFLDRIIFYFSIDQDRKKMRLFLYTSEGL